MFILRFPAHFEHFNSCFHLDDKLIWSLLYFKQVPEKKNAPQLI